MNLPELKRALDRLAVLNEIRSRKQEKEDEETLALLLLALLAQWYEDKDSDAFKMAFLLALKESFRELDPDDEYGQLVEQELAYQAGFLIGFIQDLRNKKISEAQAWARVGSYARSLGKLKNRIEIEKAGDSDLFRWDIYAGVENCDDCKELDGQIHPKSYWIAHHIPKDGRTICGQSCYCGLTKA